MVADGADSGSGTDSDDPFSTPWNDDVDPDFVRDSFFQAHADWADAMAALKADSREHLLHFREEVVELRLVCITP